MEFTGIERVKKVQQPFQYYIAGLFLINENKNKQPACPVIAAEAGHRRGLVLNSVLPNERLLFSLNLNNNFSSFFFIDEIIQAQGV